MTFRSCSHGMVREETRLQQGLRGSVTAKNVGLKGSLRREGPRKAFCSFRDRQDQSLLADGQEPFWRGSTRERRKDWEREAVQGEKRVP